MVFVKIHLSVYLTPVYKISGFVLGAGKVAVDNALSNLTTQFLNTVRSIFYVFQQEHTNCKPKRVCNWNDVKIFRPRWITEIAFVKVATYTTWSVVATVTEWLEYLTTRMLFAQYTMPGFNTLHPALPLLSEACACTVRRLSLKRLGMDQQER